ncbi:hypothetical protein BD309DRAFT_877111 [Dichomitus squalens]|uniref:Uncharacterized protein n=2 Tax=Dichomitus squalens TaxID=114155 RepID=A0A4Q9ND76_9APHY|nr:uncharacterized protein DICSQDRAFT_138126 [Dichomitus squalens LYAD-421 SS1]EJF59917.1 hypothetical protein DICSQDRAFT_138126 [Dichomitus squalens LYAD-421 SS1]TBU26244.1 hypothetical protein BD311DRAFT_452679 [Dichomitus squalens]TBU37096.1 hypothetical protein BD309DRAFT_877111 [Dichomitus squalens]
MYGVVRDTSPHPPMGHPIDGHLAANHNHEGKPTDLAAHSNLLLHLPAKNTTDVPSSTSSVLELAPRQPTQG